MMPEQVVVVPVPYVGLAAMRDLRVLDVIANVALNIVIAAALAAARAEGDR